MTTVNEDVGDLESRGRDVTDFILPIEILIEILGLLSPFQLIRCRQVSFQFNQIVTNTPILQYKIELGLSGYEDIPCSGLGVAAKLEALKSLQNAWRRPQPQIRRQVFNLRPPSGWGVENWMIVDGMFGIHSVAQEVAHADSKRTRLDLISLHDVAMTNDTQTRRKTLLFDVESFNSILCPHQQLVILIGDDETHLTTLYLMSSIDGQPHPRAKQYYLRLLECVHSVHIVTIQEVWNDFLLLGVQLKGCPNVFIIHLYHWPSGRLINTWNPSPELAFHDGLIPNSRHLLLVGFQRRSGGSKPIIQVFSLPQNVETERNANLLATFCLPFLRGVTIGAAYWTEHQISTDILSKIPFRPSRFTLLHLRIIDYSVFIPLSALLREAVVSQKSKSTPLVYPWNEWGPQATNYLPRQSIDPILSGLRAVFPSEIWDFSPKHLLKSTEPNPHATEGKKSKVFSGRSSEGKDVPLRLPYRRFDFHLPDVRQALQYLLECKDGPMLLQISLRSPMHVDIVSF